MLVVSRAPLYEVAQLPGVAAFARWKADKQARRDARRAEWLAKDKADHGAVWVDLPTGLSVRQNSKGRPGASIPCNGQTCPW